MNEKLTLQEILDDIDMSWFGGKDDVWVGLALAGEVGELCNFIKKENRQGAERGDHQEDIEKEIFDVLFYLGKLIRTRNVDLYKVWHTKMNHNEKKYGRPILKRPFTCNCEKCQK